MSKFPRKDIHLGLGPILIISFEFHYLWKDFVSIYSHILEVRASTYEFGDRDAIQPKTREEEKWEGEADDKKTKKEKGMYLLGIISSAGDRN